MSFVQTRPASRQYFPDAAPLEGVGRQWLMRSANFIVAYAEVEAGVVLERDNPDEYFVYLAEGAARLTAGDQAFDGAGGELFIVPPGESRIETTAPSRILRVFSRAVTDLPVPANSDVYVDGGPEVAPFAPWPAPFGGYALRRYRLADYADRKMRLFRSANLMINVFDFNGPRDIEALSPHYHDDFEQGSFGMTGEWVHSLRYPWSKKLADWREDEHLKIGSPSLLVIPATVIHTSRSVAPGPNQLVDIFSPPRRDFCEMGLVNNADDYPMPGE